MGGLTVDALRIAETTGNAIRLIASIHPDKKLLEASPPVIPKDHPLVVGGTQNAVTTKMEFAGPITFIGRGWIG
ncbi:MAG: hypothetical protein LBU24_02365 [Methanocalculaceae archaeon]|jgi:homoserine dehydrogenase|nr:hypothetical protein [Methanocalculaceae archaeon]